MDTFAMRQLTVFLLWLVAGAAYAHDVEEEHVAREALQWGAEPWVLACLALSLLLYVLGAWRLWPRTRLSRPQMGRQCACFAAGWITLVLALASPLDGAGSVAFSAHMVQHELLMIVCAPLMVLGRPLGVWIWALPPSWRSGVGTATRARAVAVLWHAITRPLTAWMLHLAALWLWHVPSLFQYALRNNGIHALQHASFLFTALLFWWAVLGKQGLHGSRGASIVYLFTTMMHTGALGALFTMSETVWYPVYGDSAQAFGLSALEDQQLGGLIMWIPGGLAYVAAGLVLCAGWLMQPRASSRASAMRGASQ
jgi:putative membrane protein